MHFDLLYHYYNLKKCLSLFNTILQCPVPKISQIKLKLTCMYAFEEDFASTQMFCKPLVCNLNYNSEVEDYLSISAWDNGMRSKHSQTEDTQKMLLTWVREKKYFHRRFYIFRTSSPNSFISPLKYILNIFSSRSENLRHTNFDSFSLNQSKNMFTHAEWWKCFAVRRKHIFRRLC